MCGQQRLFRTAPRRARLRSPADREEARCRRCSQQPVQLVHVLNTCGMYKILVTVQPGQCQGQVQVQGQGLCQGQSRQCQNWLEIRVRSGCTTPFETPHWSYRTISLMINGRRSVDQHENHTNHGRQFRRGFGAAVQRFWHVQGRQSVHHLRAQNTVPSPLTRKQLHTTQGRY